MPGRADIRGGPQFRPRRIPPGGGVTAGNPAFPATTQPRATRGGSLRALTQDQPMAGFGLTLAAPLMDLDIVALGISRLL